jgi:hypothetical protein
MFFNVSEIPEISHLSAGTKFYFLSIDIKNPNPWAGLFRSSLPIGRSDWQEPEPERDLQCSGVELVPAARRPLQVTVPVANKTEQLED